MPDLLALTRAVSPALARAQRKHLPPMPLAVDRARCQHAAYRALLRRLGCRVRTLPADPALPDCMFIEDTAVVLDGLAVITRPGAESRRRETTAVARALAAWRPLVRLTAPATLDGGDCLRLGSTLYVGLSSRTNRHGIDQLAGFARRAGCAVRAVPVGRCLHLKSAASALDPDTVLINRDWCDPAAFGHARLLPVDPDEPRAANTLNVDGTIVMGREFPATRARVEGAGYRVASAPADELAKAEGGVSCCSLVFPP